MLTLSSVVLLWAVINASAAPRPSPAQATGPASTPYLPTITYNIPGILNSSLTPILGKGPDGGIEVGGVGAHSGLGGAVYEHGTGDAQVAPGAIEVCLTQTFEVGPVSIAYSLAVGAPTPCTTGSPQPTQ